MTPNTADFNSDELEAPAWMTADFFAQVLRNCEPSSSDLKVISFKISPGTGKGDHYASIMFRVNVEYQVNGINEYKSLIVKTMPDEEGHKKEMLYNSFIFETEIGMYSEVLPRFERILREIGDNTVLKAPCLYYSLHPRKVIVFEDIVPKGYAVIRGRSATKDEAKCAYAKLAKWHAISYKINLEEPAYFEQYHHTLLSMPNALEDEFMVDGILNFISLCKSDPKLNEYAPYFEKLQPNVLRICQAFFEEYRENPNPDAYYVLCHGDFHMRNMMFKHNANTGQFDDVMLLDFQVCNMGSITLDLIYSIFMLLDEQLRDDLPEMLHFYFTNFTETLKKIGFEGPMPKLMRLREQMMRHKDFELFLLTTFLPIWMVILKGKTNPEELLTSSEDRAALYKNAEYIAEVHKYLPRYLHLGYFDD